MQTLEIARAVRQNLRRPSHQQLAQPTVLRAMSDCQKRILREAQLSDRGWMETWSVLHPATIDDPLALDNFSIPTRVEQRTNGETDDHWVPVAIVNHDGFYEVTEDAVAFYGFPPRIAYSPLAIDLRTREYRVWYETSPAVLTQLTQEVAVADLFSDLLTDETSLYCLPLVENDSPEWDRFSTKQMIVIRDRVNDTRDQWKKWLNMSRENNVIYADGFRPGSSYGEAAYIGPDGYLRAS